MKAQENLYNYISQKVIDRVRKQPHLYKFTFDLPLTRKSKSLLEEYGKTIRNWDEMYFLGMGGWRKKYFTLSNKIISASCVLKETLPSVFSFGYSLKVEVTVKC